jgi:hypothetical protein
MYGSEGNPMSFATLAFFILGLALLIAGAGLL